MKFKAQKVIIAGGTSGIGLATAKHFKAEGAEVTVTGRNPDRLKEASNEGLTAEAVDSQDRKALDEFFKQNGPIDHLIIALGGSKGIGAFAKLSLEELRQGFAEKFWPQLDTLQAALPVLKQGASVTLITACSGTAKVPGVSGLTAINGSLELMIPALSKELTSIRINAVSPGVVDTPWWDFMPAQDKPQALIQWTANIPAKRPAQPEEIADAIAFLAGNAYVTGKTFIIDGGMV